jgi:Methyltransferase domain/Putative zinc binding domain
MKDIVMRDYSYIDMSCILYKPQSRFVTGDLEMKLLHLDKCSVCGNHGLLELWDLPNYPFTETFGSYDSEFPSVDQKLLWCENCTHIQLSSLVDSRFLYNSDNYALRTLLNAKIGREISFLTDFILDSLRLLDLDTSNLHCLEFGGNNLVFAKSIKDEFKSIKVVDPMAPDYKENSLESFAVTIEEFAEHYQGVSGVDIVIARHTLEHIGDPSGVINSLVKLSRSEFLDIFIECPSQEQIVFRSRWDTVTHQHIHYFSVRSMRELFLRNGYSLVNLRLNTQGSNGGSMIYHFSNRLKLAKAKFDESLIIHGEIPTHSYSLQDIYESIDLFRRQAKLMYDLFSIRAQNGVDTCFGASLLLPTLNYHLNGLIEKIGLIHDDDSAKSGVGYKNLRVEISSDFSKFNPQNRILITSLENTAAIAKSLLSRGMPNVFCFMPISAG